MRYTISLKLAVIALAGAFSLSLAPLPSAMAEDQPPAHETPIPPRQSWSFAGVAGRYDPAQLRRGFQVFNEVCSACHSAKYLALRNLAEPGGPSFTVEQVKEIAAAKNITDGVDVEGKALVRPGVMSDTWPSPFPNDEAAKFANNGGLPPDMSLLAKARGVHDPFPRFIFNALPGFEYQEGGVDYITAIMNGYKDEAPHGIVLTGSQSWNDYFPGGKIMMPKPLSDGVVTYKENADKKIPETVDQYAKDVSAYLMWMAEPHLDSRKKLGLGVILYLIVFSGLLYLCKKAVWSKVH